MTTVTSRDIQEIVSKLSSDKAKAREEGIKLLNTWLEGERSINFCKFLSRKTAMIKPDQIPGSETWPFLISLLIDCTCKEISASKKRVPKLMYAKTLRIVIQRAEDAKGDALPLVTVAKPLLNHIWDVLKDVPTFHSEYGIILRHVLAVREYRFHMRKRVYCGLVLVYMEKVGANLSEKQSSHSNLKEEGFRCILTLHSLLENPPGDFPENIREDVAKGFVGFFASVREEGKISRKLIECLNTYLLEDGPNLGYQSLEIHDSVQQFVSHFWLTTHDRALKDALILYAKLQLNLCRGSEVGGPLIEQLLDVVSRDLDQCSVPSITSSRSDIAKDERFGTSSHHDLLELAALVFYRACASMNKLPLAEKRARKENAATYLREGLVRGKSSWHATFCYLCHNYGTRLAKDLFIYWFDGICSCFGRILSDANMEHSYDGLLWTLRSLRQLFFLLLPIVSRGKVSLKSSSSVNKITWGWQTVWSCLVHDLPVFSNITSVADVAFRLLGDMVSHDIVNTTEVTQDVWDLQCFKHVSSLSTLYFISSYFSRKGSQGDLRDNLHLRQNVLRGVMSIINMKEVFALDEDLVILLPAAIYAVSAGVSAIPDHHREAFGSHINLDAAGAVADGLKGVQLRHGEFYDHFECFVNVLAEISFGSQDKEPLAHNSQGVRLPRQLRDPLLLEMKNCVLSDLEDKKSEKRSLPDIFLHCALLSNFLYGSFIARVKEETSLFQTKLTNCLLDLVESAVSTIHETLRDAKTRGFFGSNSSFDGTSSIVYFRSFLSCPIFSNWGKGNESHPVLQSSIVLGLERLLKALSSLYTELSNCERNLQSETVFCEASAPISASVDSTPSGTSKSRLVDMELDVADESAEAVLSGTTGAGISFSGTRWKMDILSLISCCFSVLPVVTWDILFDILGTESHAKVRENILRSLCQNFHWSLVKLTDLINLMDEMIQLKVGLRLHCFDDLASICCLVSTLLSLHCNEKDKDGSLSFNKIDAEQSLANLGDLLNRLSESSLLDWRGRVKLVLCICDFISLNPLIGQTMIQRLLTLLRDPDYRVRFSLARRIGILFLTWDGHDELFQDICSNFGSKLIFSSKEKLVTAKEVLTNGSQPRPLMETIIITLMHIAFHSEKVELEAVFMICVISAIDPCQRELVQTVLDNLARQLQYGCRLKYLEELMGPLLFSWVACGVSLTALVQIRNLFVSNVEPNHFMLYCCQWLLPALILHDDTSNLQLVAQVTRQPLAGLVRNHFVPVFSVCMALLCSKRSGWEKGSAVLQRKILSLAEISEEERDKLIKKHMVTIVCQILSLASSASEATIPLFSREIVELAVRTVVDGFLEPENYQTSEGVVDKINIFRSDRVFMLLVELHYKVTAAINRRHKSHRLAGIEVLISILGHRVAAASTSCYLFNLIGQFISSQALQEQCCRMISTLLRTFKSNPSKETTRVLGEQLQFLVSKLVACCIPSVANAEGSCPPSSQVLSLLQLLTVDSDPILHDYIRVSFSQPGPVRTKNFAN